MRYLMILAILVMAMGCGEAVTGPDPTGDNSEMRTLTYVVTGPMRTVAYFGYYRGEGLSEVIPDCMVPFHKTVTYPADGLPAGAWVTKHDEAGHLTLMVLEDGVCIGYAEAPEGTIEARWIEWQ